MTRQILPPDIDDRYELGDVLGTGGAGAVYKAIDRESGSAVAVKVLHLPLDTESARTRFHREVAAHERLRNVPGVVRIHAHGITESRGWLAMDCHEMTLSTRLASLGPMTPAEAVPLLRDCASALGAIHDAGMLHRDVKPSNVFVTPDGRAVLADLGVVQFAGEPTLTGMTPLSLQWAAPETIETGASSAATDIYSLGTTAFAMLEGLPPFDLGSDGGNGSGETIAVGPALRLIASGDRPRLGPQVPESLRTLVDDMIAVDPDRRPPSAEHVQQRLADHSAAAARPDERPNSRSRSKAALAVMMTLLTLGIVAGLLLVNRGDDAAPVALTDSAVPAVPVPSDSTEDREADDAANQAAATTADSDTSVSNALPTTAPQPTPSPVAVSSSTPASTSTTGTTCNDRGDWCDALVLDEWAFRGNPEITTFREVPTEFGTALQLTAGPATEDGYWAEKSLSGIGTSDTIALKMRVRFDDSAAVGTDESSFQTLATISDERGNYWNVNVANSEQGIFFNTGFFAPEDTSGGSSAPTPVAPNEWHCVELVLTEGAPTPVELRVNGEVVTTLDDQAAGSHGVGFLLSLGPRWLEGSNVAPTVTVADAVVANDAIGC